MSRPVGRPRLERSVAVRDHHSAKWASGQFVGWDGEGANDRPLAVKGYEDHNVVAQDYVYLAVHDAERRRDAEVMDPRGIPTAVALAFLTEQAALSGPHATHVCFGMGYDANMILRDLGRSELRRLLEGERIVAERRFHIQYRPRKSLWVKNLSTGHALTLWDIFGFFQSSFVKAVEKNLGPDDKRLPLIRAGKARRDKFSLGDLPFIRRYTHAELTALTDLASHLRRSFDQIGWRLRRWDGAGAAAAALLSHEGFRRHLDRDISKGIHDAALCSYSGGRIEALRYGYSHDEKIYHGDIRSAYPYAFSTMPSLQRGRWRAIDGESTEPFSMSFVEWNFQRLGDEWPLLPFKFRENRAIYFPTKGSSWMWHRELESARRWDDLRRRLKVVRSFEFIPDEPNDRPFLWMKRWYDERRRMKRENNASELAVKLGLNSAYGKCAQNVGGHFDRDGNFVPPPFHQIEYAGYITSFTRAQLFDAAAPVRRSVIMLATDGVWATEPLRLTTGEGLGEWEASVHTAVLVAQSGVYWSVNPRRKTACERCGGGVVATILDAVRCADPRCGWSNLTHHFRGFDEGSLDPSKVLRAWLGHESTVSATSHRFITMAYATQFDSTWKLWRCWMDDPRSLDIHATGKREDVYPPSTWKSHNPALGLLPTRPARVFATESAPYELAFAREAKQEADDAAEQVAL